MTLATEILNLDLVREAFPEGAPRYAHIESAVRLAEEIEKAYGKFDGKLKLAVLYHDIGYAKQWDVTGFHPVDGAIAARAHGLGEDIAQAILYHSGSWQEARLMYPDLDSYYASECRMMETPLARAVTYCDLHTSPLGQNLSLDERVEDFNRTHATNQPLVDIIDAYYQRFQAITVEWQQVLETSYSKKVA